MGRKLTKRPKLTFKMYNDRIDEYISEGYTEDEAIDKASNDFLNGMYELDPSDPINKAIMAGGIQLKMLEDSLKEVEPNDD